MIRTIKSAIVITILLSVAMHSNCNDMIINNKTIYEMTAATTYKYLDYQPTGGASSNACSPNGKQICSLLNKIVATSRSFTNPSREDLKSISLDAMRAFRDFDVSSNKSNRKIFAQSLINLLQATLPLLSEQEIDECRMLIQRIKTTLL
jgi:hypothetical protein